MKLYYTVNSPYARKVRIAAIEKEIYQDIEKYYEFFTNNYLAEHSN